MADEPAVAVAAGGDAPTVDEEAAGQASAAAGASAVLAGQAGEAAQQAQAAAELAAAGASAAAGAGDAAAAATAAAAETAAERGQLEQFMASQVELNQAMIGRLAELSTPPPPPPAPDGKPKGDAPPKPKEHWYARKIGRSR